LIKRYVTIRLNAPRARAVFLAGTFNDWNPRSLPMQRGATDEWLLEIPLEVGDHQFKFVVDGQWCCDVGPTGPVESAAGCVANAFGTMNRTLFVRPPEPRADSSPPSSRRDEAPRSFRDTGTYARSHQL
jgi:hypothetical protein